MTDRADATRHWDGQQWLRWDGTAWVPEAPPPPAQSVAGSPPASEGSVTPETARHAAPPRAGIWFARHRGWTTVGIVLLLLIVFGVIGTLDGSGKSNPAAASNPPATSTATTTPTSVTPSSTSPPASPTAPHSPPSVAPALPSYPPTSIDAARIWASANGDPTVVTVVTHDTVGLPSCPETEQRVTIPKTITGREAMADLLRYFFATPGFVGDCGSVLFAYYPGDDTTGQYTAGRVIEDVTNGVHSIEIDSSGADTFTINY